MATTITKPETLFGKRVRRQEDPRLITGTALYLDDLKMPGMHHACVVRSPHGAAKIKGIDTKAALAHAGRRGGLHRRRHRSISARCRARRRCPDCACRIITCWRRIACTTWAIRSPSWWPPTATSRATRRTWWKSTTSRPPAVADPGEGARGGRSGGASRVARQRGVQLPPGGRRHGGGVPRGRSGDPAAHHQPAADSDRDGDARRGRRVARRRKDR